MFAAFLRTYTGFDYRAMRALPYRLWTEMLGGVDLSGIAEPDPARAERELAASITRLEDYRQRHG